jgi:uncharacterized protein
VLVDTRRLEDSWYAVDRLEHHGTPFIVARNNFEGSQHTLNEIREALSLSENIPVIECDARETESSKQVLIALVKHLYALSSSQETTP